jgi:hypothetical protein
VAGLDDLPPPEISRLPPQTQTSLLNNRFSPGEVKTYLNHARKQVRDAYRRSHPGAPAEEDTETPHSKSRSVSPSAAIPSNDMFADLIPN